jgi:hypothetical protein
VGRDAAVHHPGAPGLAILGFDPLQEVAQRRLVRSIAGHHLVGPWQTIRRHDRLAPAGRWLSRPDKTHAAAPFGRQIPDGSPRRFNSGGLCRLWCELVAQKHDASLPKPLAVSQGARSAPHAVSAGLGRTVPDLIGIPRSHDFQNRGQIAKVGLGKTVTTDLL